MTQEEITKIESLEKVLLTEYSKYLEKRGYMDSDWWCEGKYSRRFFRN